MLKLFVSKSVGIFVVKTFTKNGTKITNYALLESKTCNKTIVKAEEMIFVNTLVPENCFFTTTTFCRKTGTKLVQKRYKIWYKSHSTNTNFQILSRSEKLTHHQRNDNHTTKFDTKIGKKVPIIW